jgi:phosphate starvation-inducible PhoH-like protein
VRNTIEGIRVSRHIVKAIERHTGCALHTRGTTVTVEGDASQFELIRKVLQSPPDDPADVGRQFDILAAGAAECPRIAGVRPRSIAQARLVKALQSHQLTLALGPAGSGKTFLACCAAVDKLLKKEVQRIVLCRPAMEAGESLGYLPGGIDEKMAPFLRPLVDALFELLGAERTTELMANRTIEVLPLAYMRGTTLKNAFVILDEAQNASREQVLMFLTRLGLGSTAAVVGDPTQVDHQGPNGLTHAVAVLEGTDNIAVCRLTGRDVVRSPLVASIVAAYENAIETG